MEKLFIGLILLTFGVHSLCAQDSLCVFSAKGEVFFQTPATKVRLHKGDYIVNTGRLNLAKNASLITIDQDGSLYYIDQPGTHHFNH